MYGRKKYPSLKKAAIDAYRALEKTGTDILRAIAIYLGLEENFFDEKIRNGNSILRPIHYFPIQELQRKYPLMQFGRQSMGI